MARLYLALVIGGYDTLCKHLGILYVNIRVGSLNTALIIIIDANCVQSLLDLPLHRRHKKLVSILISIHIGLGLIITLPW